MLIINAYNITDADDMETTTEWLKHNDDPAKVRAEMRKTVLYRRQFIHPTTNATERPGVAEILSKFPRLLDPGMVNLSFENIMQFLFCLMPHNFVFRTTIRYWTNEGIALTIQPVMGTPVPIGRESH